MGCVVIGKKTTIRPYYYTYCAFAVLVWPLLDLKKKEGRWNVVTLVLEGVIIVRTLYALVPTTFYQFVCVLIVEDVDYNIIEC